MRLTVIGSGPAAPQPDTPASGLLVEEGDARLLLDCGLGVTAALSQRIDPLTLSAVIVGHLHADHYLDLAGLRYLFPWGEPAPRRLPVLLPPGGRERLAALATAVSERPGFFDAAFDVREYADEETVVLAGLEATFVRSHHYVPAWSIVIRGQDGKSLVYGGDTGPNTTLSGVARDADLLVCEATLASADEDTPDRGHLSLQEALDIARAARARRLLLTHYPSSRRPEMADGIRQNGAGPSWIGLAVPGMVVDLGDGALPRPQVDSPRRLPKRPG